MNVKVIAGTLDGAIGPVKQPATDPIYMDIRLDAGVDFALPVPAGHSAFVYVYEGGLTVGVSREAATINAQELAVLGDGTEVRLSGRAPRTRAILVAGRPLREPVARYGPFVMNTREELHAGLRGLSSPASSKTGASIPRPLAALGTAQIPAPSFFCCPAF